MGVPREFSQSSIRVPLGFHVGFFFGVSLEIPQSSQKVSLEIIQSSFRVPCEFPQNSLKVPGEFPLSSLEFS